MPTTCKPGYRKHKTKSGKSRCRKTCAKGTRRYTPKSGKSRCRKPCAKGVRRSRKTHRCMKKSGTAKEGKATSADIQQIMNDLRNNNNLTAAEEAEINDNISKLTKLKYSTAKAKIENFLKYGDSL